MKNKKIIIFTGPSITKNEASKILDADYRGPVKRNDIKQVNSENPDIIGIIDGVFHQNPAVGHKEIMAALNKGIMVVGSSSMGALRAAELDSFGMIGIGYVYEKYRDGEIESDDDVVLTFTEDDYIHCSEALITIEYSFKEAKENGIINEKEYNTLYSTAKSLFYPKRNYPLILHKAKLNEKTKINLEKFIDQTVDIKKQDAIKLLEYIKNINL
ncbi:TfuA-related McrA-glycine thioamidation protein [Methanobrevibacter curvatus]|uniref:TfuA-like protein n=1 Tax=Methanobrevibacter curvatus TaxID=49547 RepID=A0A166C1A0_9EURY|nr:TfuA-related McrA-glycine thioamidation protein [Methanobrevibacter curvatus]KZX14026.1 TfuA-like protein [Methanobrevibacter curvatus]